MSKQTKDNKKKESNIFLGCMFVGIGLGFVFDYIAAGTLIGMGVGFIMKQYFSK